MNADSSEPSSSSAEGVTRRLRAFSGSGSKGKLISALESLESLSDTSPDPQDGTDASDEIEVLRKKFAADRAEVSVWKTPRTIFTYLGLYILENTLMGIRALLKSQAILGTCVAIIVGGIAAYMSDGPHQQLIGILKTQLTWYGWWIALGIASSVGLGTGLHTFVLFLGPHIAHVTLTAHQCHTLNFSTHGPESFSCEAPSDATALVPITILQIARKVRWESFFWGMGTAIGELPPYFVARAAGEAGRDDQGIASIESIAAKPAADRSMTERAQVAVYKLIQSLGFFGILLCASIPNPLFDLAGIMCGHFGVPFMTFFGATFLGKAVFKSSIQTISVIVMFSEEILAFVLAELNKYAPWLHDAVKSALNEQVMRYRDPSTGQQPNVSPGRINYLSFLWNGLLFTMITYFALSLVESLAVVQMKRVHDRQLKALQAAKRKENGSSGSSRT
ncbi:hypothetical protein BC832DRAFT_590642 [Gaertneriomyces semiglobifer]|nr:hypothetical protein BC832DRAFT_590642 [Gaertneriomyces semiglobifer]